MTDLFPPDAVIRRVNLEPAVALGAGRALVLQLANPAVAQGVADHSEFQRNPFARLQGTLEAMYAIVFGPADLARGVARRVRWIHELVVGPGYRANDPEHLLWVHATLADTALRCYQRMVRPLPPELAETYYQEMKVVAELFGVPVADQPATLADFERYVADTVASLEVTDAGRELAGFVVDPTLPLRLHVPLAPPLRLHRLVTVGATPAAVRDQLGWSWDERRQARLDRLEAHMRRLARATPRSARTAPARANGRLLLWQARRHVERFEARAGAHPAPPTAA